MYKKILFPTDGSELSECAMSHLVAVARGCQVPDIVLLRVIEPPLVHEVLEINKSIMQNAREGSLKDAKRYLAELADKLSQEGLKASTVTLQGQPADEILNFAKNNNIDLIIMSTHGRSGVARWTMGSVADKIVRHSISPVLTVSPASCRI